MPNKFKRFKPKFVKRAFVRRSGLGQTGAHGTSHRQNPPDIHRLGWAPRPFPRTGLTGAPNSSIMGSMGTGQLAYYTDEDKEEFEKQSGPPGKGGNYKSSMSRTYIRKGGGQPMIGLPAGVIGESELRNIIRNEILEMKGDPDGAKAFAYELMRSQEGDDDAVDEDDDVEEASVAAGVAGYSLPLGMSNRDPNDPPPWASYASAIGGTPLKVTGTRTLKVRRMNKTDKY